MPFSFSPSAFLIHKDAARFSFFDFAIRVMRVYLLLSSTDLLAAFSFHLMRVAIRESSPQNLRVACGVVTTESVTAWHRRLRAVCKRRHAFDCNVSKM